MSRSVLLLLALTFSIAHTALAQTAARANTCCGLIAGKIYCYGGFKYTSPTDYKVDGIMNILDITKKNGTSASNLQNMWSAVSFVTNDVGLETRTDLQCLVAGDQNRIIINGGFNNVVRGQLKNTQIIYNAVQNTWFAHPDYTEPPYGKRQIYYGSASYVPGKGVAYYGGFEQQVNPNWTTPETNISVFTFSNGQSRAIGFTQVAYFNADSTESPWSTALPLTTVSDQFLARHISVFDPVNKMLLFMGGEYRTRVPPSINGVNQGFNYIKAFDTEANTWSFINFTGNLPKPGRLYFTLTLLPSTNRHVLLYGGELGASVETEYCFVLNLDTKTWKKQIIDAPPETLLSRSRHSSVLVNNDTLFVMWGIDGNKVGTSSVILLNVTNPDNITLSDTYVNPNASNADDDDDDDDSFGASGLSSGAKAGITVGCVAVAILAAIAIWFYLRNKKKNEKIKAQQHELTQQQQQSEYYDRTDVEPMEVDWDQIENKYMEMPASHLTNNNINGINVNNNNNSTGSPGTVTTSTLVGRPDTQQPVHPDGVETDHPHAYESPRVMKPDGGYN